MSLHKHTSSRKIKQALIQERRREALKNAALADKVIHYQQVMLESVTTLATPGQSTVRANSILIVE